MKFFIITFLGILFWTRPSLASNPTIAASKTDDWSTILSDRDLMVFQPNFAKYMGPKGIFNVCHTDDEFRSIDAVSVCNEYKSIDHLSSFSESGAGGEFHCLKKSPAQIAISRNIATVHERCEKSVIFQSEDKNAECLVVKPMEKISDKLSLEVVHAQGEARGQSIFIKEYEIPRC